jgi:hypothetical protein
MWMGKGTCTTSRANRRNLGFQDEGRSEQQKLSSLLCRLGMICLLCTYSHIFVVHVAATREIKCRLCA